MPQEVTRARSLRGGMYRRCGVPLGRCIRFGWHAVGRGLLRDLRTLIARVGQPRGLHCMKSTGDCYLVTFHDPLNPLNERLFMP